MSEELGKGAVKLYVRMAGIYLRLARPREVNDGEPFSRVDVPKQNVVDPFSRREGLDRDIEEQMPWGQLALKLGVKPLGFFGVGIFPSLG